MDHHELVDLVPPPAQAAVETPDAHSRRSAPRFDLGGASIILIVQNQDGSRGVYIASARNISAGGIGFLHGEFLLAGSDCFVVLTPRNGAKATIRGTVRHCRLAEPGAYDVGVQFSQEIDPRLYLPADGDARVIV